MKQDTLQEVLSTLETTSFDLTFEAAMVQNRILHTFLEVIEKKKITQAELSERMGLSQPFLSALLNSKKKLNVEHIAKFQHALGIVLQPPQYLSIEEHENKFYENEEQSTISQKRYTTSLKRVDSVAEDDKNTFKE